MKRGTVYCLIWKETNAYHFFGSLSAIFDMFPSSVINVTLNQLYRHDFFEEAYSNDDCIIVKGSINRKKHSV